MHATWNLTRTGKTFHSFSTDGRAICRDSIRRGDTAASFTEDDVNRMTDENLTGAYRKCNGCGVKEAGHRDRVEASMTPSNGEGDYLPPAAPVATPRDIEQRDAAEGVISDEQLDNWAKGASIGHLKAAPTLRPLTPAQRVTAVSEANLIMGTQPGWNFSGAIWQAAKDVLAAEAATAPVATDDEPAGAPASVLTPAPCGSVDEELRLLRNVVRGVREFASSMTVPDGLSAALDEYDVHMSACDAGKDRTWILSPDNIAAVDDALDAHGVPAKGYWTFTGTDTVCTGLKIGQLPIRVAHYGDTVTVRHDGTWTITHAGPRVLVV